MLYYTYSIPQSFEKRKFHVTNIPETKNIRKNIFSLKSAKK